MEHMSGMTARLERLTVLRSEIRRRTRVPRITGVVCLCALAIGAPACVERSLPAPGHLTVDTDTAAAPVTIRLSASPNSIAAGRYETETLRADLRLGGRDSGFGHVSDVAVYGDGRIAVLDRMARHVKVFSPAGQPLQVLGGAGSGPREFRDPWVLAAAGGHLVTWDNNPNKLFTVFGPTGTPRATTRPPIVGDWFHLPFRGPRIWQNWPYQTPAEDVTRRVAVLDDTTWLVFVQDDERLAAWENEPFPYEEPPVRLVQFDLDLNVIDTLAALNAPPSLVREKRIRDYSSYSQPLFSARPLFATGDGWFAVGHGDSSAIHVHTSNGESMAVVRWARDTLRISREHRLAVARWYVGEHLVKDIPEFAERWEGYSEAERQAVIRDAASGSWAFSDTAPTMKALYGDGDCLWLAGFQPLDYIDGTALTWIGINLRLPGRLRVVRIPRRGSRVRTLRAGAVFTSYRDALGVTYIERYPLDGVERQCSATPAGLLDRN